MKARKSRRRICTLFSILVLLPSAAAAQHFPPDDELRLMLRYIVEDAGAAGMVLGVLEADGTTRVVSYGTAGPGTRALGPRSVFEIGSLTKPFTAALLADMARRDEVDLDDPVSKYLPPDVGVPSFGGDAITLRHLALHTSGLPRGPDNHRPTDPEDPYAGYTVEQGYEFLAGHSLRRRPGARHEYSNIGYGLLGFALARAAGMPLPDLLRERVLAPLGVGMTQYGRDGAVAEWLARGHHEQRVVSYWSAPEVIEGAGGLYSNAEDLLRFIRANVAAPESPLQEAIRRTHRTELPLGSGGTGQALGWRTVTAPDGTVVVTHSGYSGGFSAEIAFRPDLGVGMVTLVNTGEITPRLAIPMTFTAPPPAAWRAVDVPPDVLARYVGEYRAPNGAGIYVRLEQDGFLTYQPGGTVRARLHATSDTTFHVLRSAWSLTFRTDDDGVAVMIRPDERGVAAAAEQVMVARRVAEATPPPAVVASAAAGGRRGWSTARLSVLLLAGVVVAGVAGAARRGRWG